MYSSLEIRPATASDQAKLNFFLRYEFYIHQHLDWQPVLDWLGFQPFYLAIHDGEIIACLAAPSEVKDVAWVRLFACSSLYSRAEIWNLLFEKIITSYQGKNSTIAVLGIHQWFVDLLLKKSFTIHQNIIVFEWYKNILSPPLSLPDLLIRPVEFDELSEVAKLDGRCFAPIWQLPEHSLEKAYQQAGYTTMAVHEGRIIGYQMSTESYSSAHLARLAIDPEFQGNNIGKVLLFDLFSHYATTGIHKITVNTQDDNFSSKALYSRMGFIQTEEKYPVLVRRIS
jgi:ribosomal protein S18 acetylase RimI-like enzyme